MTNYPQNPQPGYPQNPQPGYQQNPQPGYPEPGGYPQYQAPTPASPPGKTLGIVGLILAFVAPVIGIIVSAIGLSQSKKAGLKNTPALVGVILGIVFTVIWVIVIVGAIVGSMAVLGQLCDQLGSGTHVYHGSTITCP